MKEKVKEKIEGAELKSDGFFYYISSIKGILGHKSLYPDIAWRSAWIHVSSM